MNPDMRSAPRVGRFGAWLEGMSPMASDLGVVREFAVHIEELNLGTIWIGSANGNLVLARELLAVTSRICVATAIVNVWQYPAAEVAVSNHHVTESFPGRFLLGIGVGHAPVNPGYARPLAKLESYLDELDAAADPVPQEQRVIAALGPRALEIAGARAVGTLPYLVPPEHTAYARSKLGRTALVAPEQKVVLESDPTEARRIAREMLSIYLRLPNYLNNLRRFGLTDEDFADKGSDRFVDALVAWGDDEAIRSRLQAHLDAGADHVGLHLLGHFEPGRGPRGLVSAWERLADLLPEGQGAHPDR